MPDMIVVHPENSLRRDFATWAVAQRPKIRMVSASAFAVPADIFTEVPERLLIGSHVDGHRYVSPEEDESEPAASVSGDLTGVARPEGFLEGGPGVAAPEAPREAQSPDAAPLPATEPEPEAETDSLPEPEPGQPVCPDCGRAFKSERGLATHRRQVHEEN